MRVNRNKTKFVHIDPGAGHWGMHDGYGTWDETKFNRYFGVLFCKKHKLTIPETKWSDFGNCYYHECKKCRIEQAYENRRNRILEDRKKGRHIRITEYLAYKAAAKSTLDALKELYDDKTLTNQPNPYISTINSP